MRCLILSDLHLEFGHRLAERVHVRVSRPDVVILAGDIAKGAAGIAWAADTFRDLPVLYVHGNHEAYGRAVVDVLAELDEASARAPQVVHLHQRAWHCAGVRFLGVPLWTDFCLFGEPQSFIAKEQARSRLNDYRYIWETPADLRPILPADTARWHADQCAWLRAQIETPFDGKTVVITHMAPSMRSISDRYRSDLLSAAFASNLEDLVAQVDLWVHGHTHSSADYHIGGGRVVANPCGYPRHGASENPGAVQTPTTLWSCSAPAGHQ